MSDQPIPPSPEGEKKVESVIQNEATRRKKPLGRQFRDVFVGGDMKSVIRYVIMDILVPQAKDMIADAGSQGLERLIFGDSRGRRGGYRPSSTTPTRNYTNYSTRGNNPIGRGDRAERPVRTVRTEQTFDDILLATRIEAETVLDRMYDLLRSYELVSLSELYSLVGLSGNYMDNKWGWTDLNGATVRRVRDGYVLDLPKPIPLD